MESASRVQLDSLCLIHKNIIEEDIKDILKS